MSLKQKGGDGENVAMVRTYTVLTVIRWPVVKMSLKQKGGVRWGDRIPY